VRGVFIWVNGTSIDLERSVWRQVEAGQPSHMAGRVELSPPNQPSPPHVDAWQARLRSNRLKPWPADQGVGPASWPLCPLGLESGPLGPRVKYTPVVMMILIFGQLHFVIP
jgi:hypothetical protein